MIPLLLIFAQDPSPAKAELPKLTLTLTVDRAVVRVRDVPKFTVEFRNVSQGYVTLVKSLDGSQESMRYPYCVAQYWDGQKWTANPVGRCGNTNNLQASDFVRLIPSEKWSPTGEWFDWSRLAGGFEKPGVVKVRFVYDTSSADLASWLGFMGPVTPEAQADLRTRLAKVPKGRWESNVVSVRVDRAP